MGIPADSSRVQSDILPFNSTTLSYCPAQVFKQSNLKSVFVCTCAPTVSLRCALFPTAINPGNFYSCPDTEPTKECW